MTATLAIEASGLAKSFRGTRAVDGVDLAVPRGAVYGVLGPNGAGKTTTIRMLATLLRPDAGSARVLGHDIVAEADEVRGLISLTGQLAPVDDEDGPPACQFCRHSRLLRRQRLSMFRRLVSARSFEGMTASVSVSGTRARQAWPRWDRRAAGHRWRSAWRTADGMVAARPARSRGVAAVRDG